MSDPQDNGLEIAVIGLSCRFPGGEGPEAFWESLMAGVDAITDFSEEQALLAGCSLEEVLQDGYVRSRGLIDKPFAFDPEFFSITPREASVLDPQQRIFLTCAWEAFENAGYVADTVGSVGVFAGSSENSYALCHVAPNRDQLAYLGMAYAYVFNQAAYLPLRVSYKLDLQGPSVFLNTTCATSLVAVNLACKALLAGECDMALAGAASVGFPFYEGYPFEEAGGAMSAVGRCRSFDKTAQGTVPANGVGVVLLKRLSDALADGDHVRAVIKGTAVNNDGRQKIGFTAPSIRGQAEAMRSALTIAELAPQDIAFVEAHGTATPLGDPIEVRALTEAFGLNDRGLIALGSVKSNVGHASEAAGMAGLIKSVMALEHRQLPRTIHFTDPNPELDIEQTPFFVAQSAQDWRGSDRILNASVNSIGLGGTNAHVVLQQAPAKVRAHMQDCAVLITVSARTPAQLDAAVERLARHFDTTPDVEMADVAYTCHVGRKAFSHRRSIVARTPTEAATALRASASAPGEDKPAAFSAALRASATAEDPELARRLYEGLPAFRRILDVLLASFDPSSREQARRDLGQDGSAGRPSALLDFTVKLGLVLLWQDWGLKPRGVEGQGVGAIVADVAAGRVSPHEAPQRVRDLLASDPQDVKVDDKTKIMLLATLSEVIDDADGAPCRVLSSLGDGGGEPAARLLRRAGDLWRAGWSPDWGSFHKDESRRRTPLPTYPFAETVYRLDPAPPAQSPIPTPNRAATAAAAPDNLAAAPRRAAAGEGEGEDFTVDIRSRIVALWRELLGVEIIEDEDSFIALGGDSLLGARLANQLRDTFAISIPMSALLGATLLGEQVDLVEGLLIAKVEAMSEQELEDLVAESL